MRKTSDTLTLYMPNRSKKAEIKRKAKRQGKSISEIVIRHFDSIPDA